MDNKAYEKEIEILQQRIDQIEELCNVEAIAVEELEKFLSKMDENYNKKKNDCEKLKFDIATKNKVKKNIEESCIKSAGV